MNKTISVRPRRETKFNRLWLEMLEKYVYYCFPNKSLDGRTYTVKLMMPKAEKEIEVVSICIKKHAYREMEYILHLANGDTFNFHVLSAKRMPTMTEEVLYNMGRMHFQNEEPTLEAVFSFVIDVTQDHSYDILFYDAKDQQHVLD